MLAWTPSVLYFHCMRILGPKSQTFPQHTLIMNNRLTFSFRQNLDLINENSLAHRVCVCTGS